MAGKLWVRLVSRNKVVRDAVVPCDAGNWQDALAAACRALDLQVPLLVPRHERDFSSFRQARFLPEHFLERVRFDRMEAEYFDPESGSRSSADARNG